MPGIGACPGRSCKPWIDWRITCSRSKVNKTRFTYFVEKVKYDRRMDILIPLSRPFYISVDAGKPRSYLGDGKIIIRPNRMDRDTGELLYRPTNEEERVVLDVLRAGVNTYEDIVQLLEDEGDMSEWETLNTLKELKFRKTKRVIDYACDFSLFNSKSAPNIQSSLKVGD